MEASHGVQADEPVPSTAEGFFVQAALSDREAALDQRPFFGMKGLRSSVNGYDDLGSS